jgi:hypothetical protein
MNEVLKFGTDGWRGRIAEDYTFDNVRRCAAGYAAWLLGEAKRTKSKKPAVVIGHDKRFQSEDFAAAAAEVLAGHGVKVYLTNGATPTPVIAYAVKAQGALGAINITASHNPAYDNGFKVRNFTGGAIDPAGLQMIESGIPADSAGVARTAYSAAVKSGMIEMFDASTDYIANLKTLVKLGPIKKAGLKILVDPMWGNGAGWFPRLIGGGATEITEIHNVRNPSFPEMLRPEPIPPNVDVGLKTTKKIGADVCCITDGDADRCGFGDEKGGFINQLRAMALMALYLLEVRGQRGNVTRPAPQRRHLERHDVDPPVEVGAEGPGRHELLQALVRGEDHAGVHLMGAGSAHRLEGHVLEHAQQLDLHRGRGRGDLIEEDRAAVGLEKLPGPVDGGAGERSGHVAEELALEERFAQAAAGHLDEAAAAAAAHAVDVAGEERFAGAALPGDEHGGRRVGQPGRQIPHAADRGRVAHQAPCRLGRRDRADRDREPRRDRGSASRGQLVAEVVGQQHLVGHG